MTEPTQALNRTNGAGHPPTGRPASARQGGNKFTIKVYLVVQRVHIGNARDKANREVIAVRLTLGSAQKLVDALPGTWIERHVANKDEHV